MRYRVGGAGWEEEFTVARDPLARRWIFESATGEQHCLDVQTIDGDRVVRVTFGDSTHAITILPTLRGRGEYLRFLFDDEYYELDVKNELDLLDELLGEGAADTGTVELRSVMPGVIRKLLVHEGDRVEQEQPILILEAMKMENEIRAPRSGTLEQFHVAETKPVSAGQLLAVIHTDPKDAGA